MKNPIKIIILFSFLFLVPLGVSATSGACSYHGGVCGCGCCDGTSLSATCAPYYPGCSSPSPSRIYCGDNSCNGSETCSSCPRDCGPCSTTQQPDNTNPLDKTQGMVAGASTEKQSSNSWIWWILGIFGVGVVAYKIGKNKTNK